MDTIKYSIIRSRRKTISICVDGEAKVIVRAPLYISKAVIDAFVLEKREWIENKVTKAKSLINLREDSLKNNPYLETEIELIKRDAPQKIKARAEQLASILMFNYKNIRVSCAEKRWGSCSFDGSINLSWRLALLPQKVMDYVIIHELCHLRYHNHSKSFWIEVSRIMPDYKAIRKSLRNYQKKLFVEGW